MLRTALVNVCVALAVVAATAAAQQQAFIMRNDYVIVEAEDLVYNSAWYEFRTSPSGYTGRGWIEFIRSDAEYLICNAVDENLAHDRRCMASEEGWLLIPVYIPAENQGVRGVYSLDVRAYRAAHGDGGNDMWAGAIGCKAITAAGAKPGDSFAYRIGRSTPGFGGSWLALSPENGAGGMVGIPEAGKVYTFFVSPRSVDRSKVLGPDRIMITFNRLIGPGGPTGTNIDFPLAAWDPATPPSTLEPVPDAVSVTKNVNAQKSTHTVSLVPVSGSTFRLVGVRSSDRIAVVSLNGSSQTLTLPATGVVSIEPGATTRILTVRREGEVIFTSRIAARL